MKKRWCLLHTFAHFDQFYYIRCTIYMSIGTMYNFTAAFLDKNKNRYFFIKCTKAESNALIKFIRLCFRKFFKIVFADVSRNLWYVNFKVTPSVVCMETNFVPLTSNQHLSRNRFFMITPRHLPWGGL